MWVRLVKVIWIFFSINPKCVSQLQQSQVNEFMSKINTDKLILLGKQSTEIGLGKKEQKLWTIKMKWIQIGKFIEYLVYVGKNETKEFHMIQFS